jgi:hypothetical protein
MADSPIPKPKRRRLNMSGRRDRKTRIFARLRDGWSYEEIARTEELSAERVRAIVSQALEKRAIDDGSDHARLQLERLAPVLRLAADAIQEGDLRAVTPYLKVLDRMDKYRQAVGTSKPYDDNARARLLAKLNRVAVRLKLGEPGASDEPAGDEGAAPDGRQAGEEKAGEEEVWKFFPSDSP